MTSPSDVDPARTTWRWVAAVAAVITAGCAAFAVTAAVASDDDAPVATEPGSSGDAVGGVPIAISGFAFDPQELTVSVGTTVTWTNEDPSSHSVVGGDGLIASPNLGTGQTYSVTFNQPGPYSYACGIHPSMTGTVTVTG